MCVKLYVDRQALVIAISKLAARAQANCTSYKHSPEMLTICCFVMSLYTNFTERLLIHGYKFLFHCFQSRKEMSYRITEHKQGN